MQSVSKNLCFFDCSSSIFGFETRFFFFFFVCFVAKTGGPDFLISRLCE